MSEHIEALNPCRWKVFQVLRLEGENSGPGAKRDVTDYLISTEQFADFVARHRQTGVLVPESNETMQNSYLILDEKMRFLNCTLGAKTPSPSILDVPVEVALRSAGFDAAMFRKRDGEYDWSKPPRKKPEDSETNAQDDSTKEASHSSWGVGSRSRHLAAVREQGVATARWEGHDASLDF